MDSLYRRGWKYNHWFSLFKCENWNASVYFFFFLSILFHFAFFSYFIIPYPHLTFKKIIYILFVYSCLASHRFILKCWHQLLELCLCIAFLCYSEQWLFCPALYRYQCFPSQSKVMWLDTCQLLRLAQIFVSLKLLGSINCKLGSREAPRVMPTKKEIK